MPTNHSTYAPRSYRYIDGTLCVWNPPADHPVIHLPPALGKPEVRRTRRERRRWARDEAGPGRRRARRVDAWRPAKPWEAPERRAILTGSALVAHAFSDGRGIDVRLYLPEGERPTEQHGRDLDAYINGRDPIT